MNSALYSDRRIAAIDVLRGIAIMGILLVNGPTLNGPAIKDAIDFAFQNGAGDIWYTKSIFFLAVGKFYPIFACLFGISAAIFMSGKSDKAVQRLWPRRLLSLMTLGFCHAFFIWWGDILVVYSLLGLLLIAFIRRSEKQIMAMILILLSATIILSLSTIAVSPIDQPLIDPDGHMVYQMGNFFEVTKRRAIDFFGVYLPGIFHAITIYQALVLCIYFFQIIILFFVGFYIYRSGLLTILISRREYAFKAMKWMFSISSLLLLLAGLTQLGDMLHSWANITQGLFYATLVIWLCHHHKLKRLLNLFANVGRMSLSNYILHTSILSIFFYGYGFGLYGRIGPLLQAPLLLGMMLISIAFSFTWLRFFNLGPLEWLWRMATYGRIIKLPRSIEISSFAKM